MVRLLDCESDDLGSIPSDHPKDKEIGMSKIKFKIPHLVQIIPDKNDGGYFIQVPELPGCMSQGETLEEAIAMIQEAYELYMEEEKR